MNVFYVSPVSNGCSKWRVEIPAKYLRRRGHEVNFFGQKSPMSAPDAIVFGRTYKNADQLLKLYHWAKDKGVPVIYDTDDALDLTDPWNPAFTSSKQYENDAIYMATHADAVTTTTPELATHLQKWNSNVVVIPNSIDPEEWDPRPRQSGHPLRVGWLGGSSHFLDLAVALDAIADVKKTSKFTFVIYGLTTMPSVNALYQKRLSVEGAEFRDSALGRAMKVFLKKTEGVRFEFFPFVSADQYAQTLCDLAFDIGIAPLAETAFNRHKSCIKFYEYALSGAVTLASDVLPYSAEVPDRCENTHQSWSAALSALLTTDLSSRLQEQREWVLSHRSIEKSLELWEHVLTGKRAASAIAG